MKLQSTAFAHNASMPVKYTCDGENINPPLIISEVPKEAKFLVLIMDDPDAIKPAGFVWDHWIIFNMPTDIDEILEGQQPRGVAGMNSRKNLTYGGPCPPDAEHRYFFKLYALDIELALPEGSTKTAIEKAMSGHIIDQAELVGLYNRQ